MSARHGQCDHRPDAGCNRRPHSGAAATRAAAPAHAGRIIAPRRGAARGPHGGEPDRNGPANPGRPGRDPPRWTPGRPSASHAPHRRCAPASPAWHPPELRRMFRAMAQAKWLSCNGMRSCHSYALKSAPNAPCVSSDNRPWADMFPSERYSAIIMTLYKMTFDIADERAGFLVYSIQSAANDFL